MSNALVVVLAVFFIGCGPGSVGPPPKASASPAPTIDQAKFDRLYRSAKAVEGALTSGVNVLAFSDLLRDFATEVGIARDRASRPDEVEMVRRFDDALKTFVLSRQIWQDVSVEAAQRVWLRATPQLSSATRLYYSDTDGANKALAVAKAELARQEEEDAAAHLARAKRAADNEAQLSTARKIERAAYSLGDVDPQVRTRACNELASYGALAEDHLYQLEANVNGETDDRAREAAKRAIRMIKEAIAKTRR